MKSLTNISLKPIITFLILISCVLSFAQNLQEYKGEVLDKNTNKPLALADLTIANSNISTITNNAGEFSIKVPDNLAQNTVTISYLGYQKLEISLSDFKDNTTFTYRKHLRYLPKLI